MRSGLNRATSRGVRTRRSGFPDFGGATTQVSAMLRICSASSGSITRYCPDPLEIGWASTLGLVR